MRTLLEFRLSGRLGPLLAAEAIVLGVATVLIGQGVVPSHRPSFVLLMFGVFLLAAVWYDCRRMEISDRTETREALHAVLPTSRLTQALARVVEPLPPLALTILWVVLAFLGLGRFAGVRAADWRADLMVFFGCAAWHLVLEMYQLAAVDLQAVMTANRLRWLFWVVVVAAVVVPSMAVGLVIGEGDLVPGIFYLTLGRPGAVVLGLLLALLLAGFSVSVHRRRDVGFGCS